MLKDNKNSPVINTAEAMKIKISKIDAFILFSLDCMINVHHSFHVTCTHLLKTYVAGVVGAKSQVHVSGSSV